jgi:hypothetical protein
MTTNNKVNEQQTKEAFDYIHSSEAENSGQIKPLLNVLRKMDYNDFSEYLQTGEMPALQLSKSEMEAVSGGWRIRLGGLCIQGGKHTDWCTGWEITGGDGSWGIDGNEGGTGHTSLTSAT